MSEAIAHKGMTITEVILALQDILMKLGNVPVFFGSFYQDASVDVVTIEDGYPLIANLDFRPML